MFSLRLSRLSVPKCVSGRRLFSDGSLPIPAKSKGWPTPWIVEADATEYLFPLYAHGWYVATVPSSDRRTVKTAALACRFNFPTYLPAAAFIKDIFALSETENVRDTCFCTGLPFLPSL
jgi:hypothetical protein